VAVYVHLQPVAVRRDRVHRFAIRNVLVDIQVLHTGETVIEFTAPRAGRYEIPAPNFAAAGTDK